ncbi:hypothetical protein [Actinacidiphila guanduensis]|uniref:Uncharacterized protein n=1 Tax=Actinacidiphila guanduensis TaxID=310781 RepID=A0A1H0LP64_9ACTN|nr:hypothetical protein [Actinacidiphila guanduensis]SDO70049.1 hypothetical protein SAMN05216259_111286 [Actinacidiphila guanduensis]
MTRRSGAALPAAALVLSAALLLAGCGSHARAAGSSGTGGAPNPSAPSASELAHMQQLVDGAESAVATADSDAAGDK